MTHLKDCINLSPEECLTLKEASFPARSSEHTPEPEKNYLLQLKEYSFSQRDILNPYTEEQLTLLGRFLEIIPYENPLTLEEKKLLGAYWVTQGDPVLAEVYLNRDKLDATAREVLNSLLRFPRGYVKETKLLFKETLGTESISLQERCALFGILAYPHSSLEETLIDGSTQKPQALKLAERLYHEAQPLIQPRPITDRKLRQLIGKIAKIFIHEESWFVPSRVQFQRFTGASLETIEEALEGAKSPLSEQEKLTWKVKESVTSALEPLTCAASEAIRSILIQNAFAYQLGICPRLFAVEELQEVLPDITDARICNDKNFTPFLRYRQKYAEKNGLERLSELYKKEVAVAETVARELKQFQGGECSSLTGDYDLARQYEVLPITIHTWAKENLLEEQYRARYRILNATTTHTYLSSPSSYAQAELKAFKQKELLRLSTDGELASLFKVSSKQVKEELFEKLPSALFQEITVLKELQGAQRRELSYLSARSIAEWFIEPGLKGLLLKQLEENSSSVLPHYFGHPFASAAEAATASLLSDHVPGFVISPEHTVHVKLYDGKGGHKEVDFRIPIPGQPDFVLYFEFHPAQKRKKGDFQSSLQAEQYYKERALLSDPTIKAIFEEIVSATLAQEYHLQRIRHIAGLETAGHKVLHAEDARGLYHTLKNLSTFFPLKISLPSEELFTFDFERRRAFFLAQKEQRKKKSVRN